MVKKCSKCKNVKEMEKFSKGQLVCKECYRNYYLSKVQRKCLECKAICTKQRHIYCSNECKITHNVEKIPRGCWFWKGKIHENGYPITKDYDNAKKNIAVHRLSYRVFKGNIPEGKLVCHSCDNRNCVNPKHLWVGTHHDNNIDCLNKNRNSNGGMIGEKHINHKLCDKDVLEIKIRLSEGELQKTLAKEFNVSTSVLNKIALGIAWKHITVK